MKNQILEKTNEFRASPTKYCLQIKAFKHLLDRDDTENKVTAKKEFAYIYHMMDPLSSFSQYGEDMRQEKVKEAIFGRSTDWVEDAYVRQAMEAYDEMNMTEAEKLLRDAKKSSKSLRKYFREVDLMEEDDRGKKKWSAKDLINNLGKLGTVIEGIKDLEEQVEKEQMDQGQIRGGVKINKWNE